MQTVLAVVLDAIAPHREPLVELGAVEVLLGDQPRPFLVFGRAVLRQLGERYVRPLRYERRREQLLLKALEPREIGTERDDAEIGFVTEHRHAHRLMTVGFECGDGFGDVLARGRIAVGALAIDAVVEVQHTPTDRRRHGIHACQGTAESVDELLPDERARAAWA